MAKIVSDILSLRTTSLAIYTDSVFTNRSTNSTSTKTEDQKRSFSTRILLSIRERIRLVSNYSIVSIKKVARNGDFVTTISLFLAGQGCGFFGIPWSWSRGSILTGIIAAVMKCFFYTYMGITFFEASESCVGLIAGHGKDELPDLSMVVDFKYGRNWSYICTFFGLSLSVAATVANFLYLCSTLYFFVLGCFELGHDFDINSNLTEYSTSEELLSPYWTLTGTVPLFCILVIFIVNVKSSVFFTRLLAVFGLPSTILISCILFWKASVWRTQEKTPSFEPYPVVNSAIFPFSTIFYQLSYMPLIM
ncbi:unnamed protein product [Oikopleura dioica]|uniref:Amino acid transporter transmembrane domain-containing protein n=1 Tax=Oikopleura dioica TaxID=34765 RepID=E4XM33_OIKDI|nr:unnamed protein product [Oikopleura dioica]